MDRTATDTDTVTTTQLARLTGLERRTVVGWISTKLLPSSRLPGQTSRIRLADAIDFFRNRNAPCEPLEHYAERVGAVPLVNPSILVVSPFAAVAAAFADCGWGTSLAGNSVQAGIALARRKFLAVVVDGRIGNQSICDLLGSMDDAGVLGLIAAEDDLALPETWKDRGFDVVYRLPVDLTAVALDMRSLIVRQTRKIRRRVAA
jgi:hypothetical protein